MAKEGPQTDRRGRWSRTSSPAIWEPGPAGAAGRTVSRAHSNDAPERSLHRRSRRTLLPPLQAFHRTTADENALAGPGVPFS